MNEYSRSRSAPFPASMVSYVALPPTRTNRQVAGGAPSTSKATHFTSRGLRSGGVQAPSQRQPQHPIDRSTSPSLRQEQQQRPARMVWGGIGLCDVACAVLTYGAAFLLLPLLLGLPLVNAGNRTSG